MGRQNINKWDAREYCPTAQDNACEVFDCNLGEKVYLNMLLQEKCNKKKLRVKGVAPPPSSELIRLPEHIRPNAYELWIQLLEKPEIMGNVTFHLNVSRYLIIKASLEESYKILLFLLCLFLLVLLLFTWFALFVFLV